MTEPQSRFGRRVLVTVNKDHLQIGVVSIVLLCCSLASACSRSNHLLQKEMRTETELLSEIHSINQMAITTGELAKLRGTTADIRNFGVLLVRDHRDADRRAQVLANELGIHLIEPMQMTPEEQHAMQILGQDLAKLQLLSGPQFDRAFIGLTGNAHRVFLPVLQRGAEHLQSSSAKTLVNKLVPILQQHEFLCGWCMRHCLNHETY